MKLVDIVGKRYGCLTVQARAPNDKHGHSRWSCKCDCGAEVVVNKGNLHPNQKGCRHCRLHLKASHYSKDKDKATLYFVRCGDYVKIGVTNDLKKRLSAMQTDNPEDLEVIWEERNSEGLEEEYHKLFQHRHHRGEWFKFEENTIT